MVDSILDSTKKSLGILADNTAFDVDVVMHINAALSTLNQLGIGPEDGFAITDNSANWADFIGDDKRLNNVQLYVYLKTRILFDPPTGSYHLVTSMNETIKELEWRLNVKREGESWVEPVVTPPVDPQYVVIPVNDFVDYEP